MIGHGKTESSKMNRLLILVQCELNITQGYEKLFADNFRGDVWSSHAKFNVTKTAGYLLLTGGAGNPLSE